MQQPLFAIDLYSGVGGWSLGLRMAGIDVLRSYEFWDAANETNRKNNGHAVIGCDIRNLDLSKLPRASVVVGSPPCTQFSFSNRGGSGDISDGLEDIAAFLRIVRQLAPRWWVMENVPRAASIVSRELCRGGRLHEFRDLTFGAQIFNLAGFGLPQSRRRCLIGNIDFDLLTSYAAALPRRNLGDVVRAFSCDPVIDPIYGGDVPSSEIFDHIPEPFLNMEEERVNRAAKTLHPVYNGMSFPDRLDRPVRTVTATCTRVSRESIIIEAPGTPGAYRRLTLRERAVAQGFPVTFQFFGSTYAQKLRMIGNALPPLFAFYVGHAMRGTSASALPNPAEGLKKLVPCQLRPPLTPPEAPAFKYPPNRRFRFAVPSLHMKSGMRFELTNGPNGCVDWHVLFVFGTSKRIRSLRPDKNLLHSLQARLPDETFSHVVEELSSFEEYLRTVDVKHLQDVWSHTGPGLTRPLILLDEISAAGERLVALINGVNPCIRGLVAETLEGSNSEKVGLCAPRIFAGLLLAAIANTRLSIGAKAVQKRITSAHQERVTA